MIKVYKVSTLIHSGQGVCVTTVKKVRIFPPFAGETEVSVQLDKPRDTPPAKWITHFEFNWK